MQLYDIIAVGLSGIVLVSLVAFAIAIWKMRDHITLFTRGKNGASLEDTMKTLEKHMDVIHQSLGTISETLENHDTKLSTSVRGVGIVRYNPFEDSGGNQSFAVALLDETGSGVVITSLHARERASVYAKPVSNFASTFELTDEEKKAISEARQKLS